MAGGGFLVVLGSLLFTLPQLISGLYQPSGSDPNSIDGDLCQSNYSVFNPDDCLNVGPKNSLYMFIFLLANLIIGMGGSPIYTLGKRTTKAPTVIGFQGRLMSTTLLL